MLAPILLGNQNIDALKPYENPSLDVKISLSRVRFPIPPSRYQTIKSWYGYCIKLLQNTE
jgi:hypothetical protein